MKKSLLTLSMLVLFVAANAQDDKKAPVAKKAVKTEVVNPDGTTTVTEDATAAPAKNEPKKSGTRMAINEKGNAGTKHATKTEAKDTKTETSTSPTSKPQ